MRLMTQVRLESGATCLTAWVAADARLRPGAEVTLKDFIDPSRRWRVMAGGDVHPASDIKRGWNNNI